MKEPPPLIGIADKRILIRTPPTIHRRILGVLVKFRSEGGIKIAVCRLPWCVVIARCGIPQATQLVVIRQKSLKLMQRNPLILFSYRLYFSALIFIVIDLVFKQVGLPPEVVDSFKDIS